MSKLYFESLKNIPEKFIDEETLCATYSNDRVILANPKFNPMVYSSRTKVWEDLDPIFVPFL